MTSIIVAGGLAVLVFAGASAQMITGMGFSLLVSPALVILLGPDSGIVMVNLMALGINLVLLSRMGWRSVDPAVPTLVLPALVSIAVTAGILSGARPGPVAIAAGLITVMSVLILWSGIHFPRLVGATGATLVGGVSGAMNVTAGIGGPAVSMYALNAGWKDDQLVASMQAYFVAVNALSVFGGLFSYGLPDLTWISVCGGMAGLVAGFVLGQRAADRVPTAWIRPAVLTLSAVGGVSAVVKGAFLL